MRKPGQIVLFQFPQTDIVQGKLRPALLLGKLPGPYDDWLMCMISSQIHQYIEGFDEIIDSGVADFSRTAQWFQAETSKSNDVYCIRYEEIFDHDFARLKDIFNKIGLEHTDRVFSNEEYSNRS